MAVSSKQTKKETAKERRLRFFLFFVLGQRMWKILTLFAPIRTAQTPSEAPTSRDD
ncbi:hypothetical protein M5D96_012145, partial [Drosophila gunungcola]